MMSPNNLSEKKKRKTGSKDVGKDLPAAKKSRLPKDRGFELQEQFSSSDDYKFIESKMHDTMKPSLERNIFSGYQILQIFKVVNLANMDRYSARLKQMNKEIFGDDDLSGAYVEMHLWHGSPFAEKICKEGFKLGPARNSGKFGKGVYFAEHSSKSNCYSWGVGGGCPAHRNQSCHDCTRMMLLCKVALRRKILTPAEYACRRSADADITVAKSGVIDAGLAYPEYVVYHQDQACPSYLIKYKLKPPQIPPTSDNQAVSMLQSISDSLKCINLCTVS